MISKRRSECFGRFLLSFIAFTVPAPALDDVEPYQWNQFRGPGGAGVATTIKSISPDFLDDKHLLWTTAIPGGQSSPIVWKDRIFLNAFDASTEAMETLGIDRASGKIIWRKKAPATKRESSHELSSPAASTPVTDGERVYTYFGSYGFIAYTLHGELAWTHQLPVANSEFGSAASPVLAGQLLIFDREENGVGAIFALDKQTGKLVWKTEHASAFRLGTYATPFIWNDQIVQHRNREVAGFRIADGKRLWWVPARTASSSSPVVVNGILYAATWSGTGEADQLIEQPDFPTLLQRYDKNGDGRVSQAESPKEFLFASRPDIVAPGSSVSFTFQRIDVNKDGFIDASEWAAYLKLGEVQEHGMIAVKLGGEGELPADRTFWKEPKSIPEIPSPVVYEGRVYMVRNGGVLTCLNAQTGKIIYRERVRSGGGPYFSSIVAAGGLILLSSFEGTVTAIRSGDQFEVVARRNFDEPIQATVAVAYDTVFVRTAKHLLAFSAK